MTSGGGCYKNDLYFYLYDFSLIYFQRYLFDFPLFFLTTSCSHVAEAQTSYTSSYSLIFLNYRK